MLRVGRLHQELHPIEIIENQESVCLVWLDTLIQNNEYAHNIQEILLELHPDVRLHSEIHSCTNLIQTLVNKHILLVITDDLAHEILSKIHSLRSLVAIFILCRNIKCYNSLMNEYEKIVEISLDQNYLLKSIEETICLVNKQIHAYNLFDKHQQSVLNSPRGSAAFLWHHLLIYVLQHMSADEQSKKDMLEKCIAYYRGNRRELKRIEQFRTTYTREEAIKWYTRDCFVYRLLNKALRAENIELLYSFRFFIIDLCNQLKIQCDKGKNKRIITKLYRGQRMSREEFRRLQRNVGTLISMNGFLSTSRDINVSLAFAGQNIPDNHQRYAVLFIIHVNSSLKSFHFADVYDKSEIPGEKEVLLSHGVTFKVNSVEENTQHNLWQVDLTATDEGADYVEEYKVFIQESMKDQSPTLFFGAFLWRDFEYIKHAKIYFDRLIQNLPSNHPDIPFIYNYIGAIHYEKHEFDLALKCYQYAYVIRQKQFPLNYAHIIASLHNIGNIHCEKGEYDQAIDSYSRALTIDKHHHHIDSLSIAGIYEALGNVFRKKHDPITALDWLNRAYHMYIRLLPFPHPHIARCLGNIALVHETKLDLDLALKYFFEEFEIEEQCLSPDHPNLGLHLNWIIIMYKKKNEREKNLQFYHLRPDIIIPSVRANPSQLISSLQIFKNSFYASTIFEKYYELTTIYSSTPTHDITSTDDKSDQLTANRCIRSLSVCDVDRQKLDENNAYWLHALNIDRRVYSTDHPEIIRSLRWVGESHVKSIRNYSEVLQMYVKSLKNFAREPTIAEYMEWDKFSDLQFKHLKGKYFNGTL